MSKHLLVTAGPTREMLDPVRFLSNVSTGTMGYAIAEAGKRAGYKVTLISGPTSLKIPTGVKFVPVVSVEDMKKAMSKAWPSTDMLIMTAAVCDYTPVQFSPQKIRRVKTKTIRFKRTPDLLKYFSAKKGRKTIVGFALETQDLIKNAVHKLRRKNLDYIVANWYGKNNNPFGTQRTSIILIRKDGQAKLFPKANKQRIAKGLLREIEADESV